MKLAVALTLLFAISFLLAGSMYGALDEIFTAGISMGAGAVFLLWCVREIYLEFSTEFRISKDEKKDE